MTYYRENFTFAGISASSARNPTELLHLYRYKTLVIYKIYDTLWSKSEFCELVPLWGQCRRNTLQTYDLAAVLSYQRTLEVSEQQQVRRVNSRCAITWCRSSCNVLLVQLGLLDSGFLWRPELTPTSYTISDNIFEHLSDYEGTHTLYQPDTLTAHTANK